MKLGDLLQGSNNNSGNAGHPGAAGGLNHSPSSYKLSSLNNRIIGGKDSLGIRGDLAPGLQSSKNRPNYKGISIKNPLMNGGVAM